MESQLRPERVSSMDQNPPLTAADRCDRCGAAAQARTAHTMLKTRGVHVREIEAGTKFLLWCAHHFGMYQDDLAPHLVWQTPLVAKRKVPVRRGA
jgi:hypothetical protein